MNIAKMAIQITANADQATAGFKKAEDAANSFGARMTRISEKVAKDQERAMKKVFGEDAAAFTRQLGMGVNKFVSVHPASSLLEGHAKQLAAKIKAEYPELAKLAQEQNKQLVRVLENGQAEVLRTWMSGGKVRSGYVAMNAANGALDQGLADQKKAMDARKKWLGYGAVGLGLGVAAAAGSLAYGSGLTETAHRASMAGAGLGEFRAMLIASGPAAAAMESSVKNLNTALGYLENGLVTSATKALGDLGMMAGGTAMQSMEAFANKLASIESPALRMATAMSVLGDNAASLMPILERGASAFDLTRKMAGQGGLGVDDSQLAKIANAQQQVTAFWETFKTRGAVLAAPLLTELGNNFDTLSGIVMGGAKGIVYAGAAIVEAWKFVSITWDGLKIGFNGFMTYFLNGMVKIIETANTLSAKLGGLGAAAQIDTGWLADQRDNWGAAFAKGQEGFVDKWANNKNALKAAEEMFNRIEKRGLEVGKNLANNPWLEGMAKKFLGDKEAMITPLEAYQRKLSEIAAFEKNGLFAGDKGLLARMQGKAFGEFSAAVNLQPLQAPGAAFKDTREAYSAIAAFERQSTRANVQDQIKALLEEGRRQNEEQIRLGREAAEALKKIAGDVVKPRGI